MNTIEKKTMKTMNNIEKPMKNNEKHWKNNEN